MQDALLGRRRVQRRDFLVSEIDAGRDDQPVIAKRGAGCKPHFALDRIDRNRVVAHALDTILVKPAVTDGNVGKRLAAAKHEIADRARNKFAVALDERDFDVG